MNTDVKCSIKEASSNELLYQIEVHNGLIPAYIVKKHDGPIHIFTELSDAAEKLDPYIFCFVAISKPRGCLEACFEACRQAHPERLFVFAPSSHGRESELQQRRLFPVLQKARCFAPTLLSPLRV